MSETSKNIVFTDVNGETPANWGQSVAYVKDLAQKSRHGLQPSSALRPVVGRMPVSGRRNLLLPYTEGDVTADSSFSEAAAESISQFNYPTFKLVRNGAEGGAFGRNNQGVRLGGFAVDTVFRVQAVVKPTSNTDAIIGFARSGGAGGARTIAVVVKPDGSSFTFERATQGAEVLSSTVESVGQGAFLVKAEIRTSSEDGLVAHLGLGDTNVEQGRTQENVEYVAYFADVQFEAGNDWTTPQNVTTPFDVTEEGVSSPAYVRFDLADDKIQHTFPDGFNGDVLVFGRKASWYQPDVSIDSNAQLDIGPLSIAGSDEQSMPLLGDIVGWLPVGRKLTKLEQENILKYYSSRGAASYVKALFEDGTWDDDAPWRDHVSLVEV